MKSRWRFWRYSTPQNDFGIGADGLFPAHIHYESTAAYLAEQFPDVIYFVLED